VRKYRLARRIEEMSAEQKKAMMTKIMSGKRTGIKKGSITSGKKIFTFHDVKNHKNYNVPESKINKKMRANNGRMIGWTRLPDGREIPSIIG
jgi:hypothetical protein